MNDSTDTDQKRPVILYIIIAVALSAALVLGVWWAKSRADYYAQQSGQVGQPQDQSTPDTASQPVQTPEATIPQPSPPATAEDSSLPVSVPAAGVEQGLLSITSICAFIFAALSYARARRRLIQTKSFTL